MNKQKWDIEIGKGVHRYGMHFCFPYKLKLNGEVVKTGSSYSWQTTYYAAKKAQKRLIAKMKKEIQK